MYRRFIALIAIAMAAFLVSASTASAVNYTPSTAPGTVSVGTISGGETVEFCGDGFEPGTDIRVDADGEVIDTIQADDNGDFCVNVSAESLNPGTVVLSAKGTGADGEARTVTATVNVLGTKLGAEASGGVDASNGTGALARTGSDLGPQLWIAGALIAFGAGLLSLTVVRRRQSTPIVA